VPPVPENIFLSIVTVLVSVHRGAGNRYLLHAV
jgi:hypothetical protein